MRARDEAATRRIAAAMARRLAGELDRHPTIWIGLRGELGAGKTAFVRGFVAGLDPAREREVSSPTYAIAAIHPGSPELRHLDLYRLGSARELEAIGGRELYGAPGIVLVEWMENAPEAWPADRIEVELAIAERDARELSVSAHGSLAAVLDALSADMLAASA